MAHHRSPPPKPAHPTRRQEPLPWEHPKPAAEEADSAARLAAITGHHSYREPDRDIDFLHTDTTRGVRLQLDYLKAEQGLLENEIRHCIVVFGSTRLREPETARRELAEARRDAYAAGPTPTPPGRP